MLNIQNNFMLHIIIHSTYSRSIYQVSTIGLVLFQVLGIMMRADIKNSAQSHLLSEDRDRKLNKK